MRKLVNKQLLIVLAILFASGPIHSWAGEVDDAKAQLQKITQDLEFIKSQGLHFVDEGSIFMLENSVNDVLKSIDEHHGVGNVPTLNMYQRMNAYFTLLNMKVFFDFIMTKATAPQIADIWTIVNQIQVQKGFSYLPMENFSRPIWSRNIKR